MAKTKKDGYQTVRLKQELTKEIDEIVNSELGKKRGLKSRADFVTRAVLELLEETRPHFEHLNTYEDKVRIVDYNTKKIVSVYFKDDGSVWCDLDETQSCPHIDYALTLEDVQKALKAKGWTRKKG